MDTYRLVVNKPNGERETVIVPTEGLRLGRSPDSDVILFDRLVSRHHAWIGIENDELVVKDTGSRNGFQVNGERCTERKLHDGDSLVMGEHTVRVEQSQALDDSTAVIQAEEARAIQEKIMERAPGEQLRVLYQAARLLGEVFDLDDLLKHVLDLVFDAIPVEHGYVLTWSDKTGQPEVRAERPASPEGSEPGYSRTVIDHVFTNGTAVLTQDAQDDERFSMAESIMSYEMNQIMCAPLIGRERCVGAIYVDGSTTKKLLTHDDLQLLTAMAQVVGVAVENAQLYQETLEKERLAAIGEATAGLGHCVKNILTGIKAGGEYLDMALDQGEIKWVERGWPVVKRASDRIEMLMLNLLTYSRERTPLLAPTSVKDLCVECADVVALKAKQANTEVSVEVDDLPLVLCDAREIYRVILNLLTNAIEACLEAGRDPGHVTLNAWMDEEGCHISCKDDGAGIPDEIQKRLSEAFVSTKGSGGTGLGLACCYKIAREHGGDIAVQSTVGEGTTFTLFIPNTADTVEAIPGAASS